jgi:hypothetical protein
VLRFTDQVVLVTGGTRGLGRACALRLADEGADVVVAARDLDACRRVAGEVRDRGRRALSVRLDVTDAESVRDMMGDTVAEFGRLDGAVNMDPPVHTNYRRALIPLFDRDGRGPAARASHRHDPQVGGLRDRRHAQHLASPARDTDAPMRLRCRRIAVAPPLISR